MTITSIEEFRAIGREDARTGGHTMFDPIGSPSHIAYLEGMIAELRSQLPSTDDLTLNITREVAPKEISYLVYGTGALSWSWWGDADWVSVVDGEEFPIEGEGYWNLDTAEPDDFIVFRFDGPDDPEGSHRSSKKVTFRELVAAGGVAIAKGYVTDAAAIREDLGMCDAAEADCVLQLAVFGEIVYG